MTTYPDDYPGDEVTMVKNPDYVANGKRERKAVFALCYDDRIEAGPRFVFTTNKEGKLNTDEKGVLMDRITDNKTSTMESDWDVLFVTRKKSCYDCGLKRVFYEEKLSYYCPVCEQDRKVWSLKTTIQP